MSAKYWKLAITSLSPGSTSAREAVVEAENWLSALRAARRLLGEDGGVPPGASCVMSSSGEVTILDAAQRLRYMLTRSEAPAQPAAAPASLPPPTVKVGPTKRSATIAYSPEESAAARAQVQAAGANLLGNDEGSGVAPLPKPEVANTEPAPAPASVAPAKFAPARPQSKPPPEKIESTAPKGDPRRPIPAKRSATVAYSPEESAQLRRGLEAARPAVEPDATPSPAPEAKPSEPTSAASRNADNGEAAAPANSSAAAPAPATSAPTRPARKQTIAYSPEESAAARAQLNAAVKTASTTTSLAASAHDHLVQSEVPSMLVTLGLRDEETSKDSPLTYRERSYYWPPPAQRNEVERALRAELASLQNALKARARGQYINLAVFDHAFGDKPERAPVATLQWKDWRGEPVFAWIEDQAGASWTASKPGTPVTSSFFPDPIAPPSPVMPASTTATPVIPHAAVPAPAAQIATPMRSPSRRESTGEQDLRLTVAFEAVQDLYFLATPADGLDFAVKLLAELVPAEAISGCIYDINTDEFRFVAVTGEGSADRRAAAVSSKQGLFGAAAHSGLDNLVVPDVMNEPRFDSDVDGRHGLVANNMAFFVLHKADQLLGMLQLINREGGQTFREADIAVASYVANQMTAFLREKRGLSHSRG